MSLATYNPDPYSGGSSHLMKRAKSNMTALNPILYADIVEGVDDFHVQVDLPGIEVTNLDVSVSNGFLNIRAERRRAHDLKASFRHDNERMFGVVQRSIQIPVGADENSADAKYDNGVLTVKFMKKEGASGVRKVHVTEPTTILEVHPYSAATITATRPSAI